MNRTNIEYLDFTYNPVVMRCTPVSDGCDNCWHLRMCDRHKVNPKLSAKKSAAYAGGPVCLDEKELNAPLRRRKPAVIGVQFMGDLFHLEVAVEMIAEVFNIMASRTLRCVPHPRGEHEDECWSGPFHQYLILTKRPARMRRFITEDVHRVTDRWPGDRTLCIADWPLENIWLGVSVEDQATADARIPVLLATPAAHRFVSIEPCLSAVNLEPWVSNLGWVILGGETGPHARPMEVAWGMQVVDQCLVASVPVFLKGWGGRAMTADAARFLGPKLREFPPELATVKHE